MCHAATLWTGNDELKKQDRRFGGSNPTKYDILPACSISTRPHGFNTIDEYDLIKLMVYSLRPPYNVICIS